jgi:integrase/recombinase XerD
MDLESGISSFCDALAFEREMARNTCEAYARDLREFSEWAKRRGKNDASGFVREDIQDFLGAEKARGLSQATRMRRLVAVKELFRHLKDTGAIPKDPTSFVDMPRKARPLPRILGEEEVARMIEGVSGKTPRDLRDRAMLEVMYGSGLRVSETCALRVEDFAADGELLRVTGKGSKDRVVPLGGAAGAALRAYFESARAQLSRGRGDPHVFLTRLGGPFTRQGVFKVIRERAAAAGISADRISPHVLRHCFASHMLQRGADIRAIQEMLGHADIGTTQIYTHVDVGRFGSLHRQFHPRG